MVPCNAEDPKQRFYMNSYGEIRVRSHPGACMDPRYGDARFVGCFSTSYGPDHEYAMYQQFTFDPSTEEIRSILYNNCVDFEFNRGVIWHHACHGGINQMFWIKTGVFGSDADEGWEQISSGNLPWISEFDRNPSGVQIHSTYESGDANRYFMEAKFYESTTPYYEYKISFLEMREPASTMVQFSELELPGLLVSPLNAITPAQELTCGQTITGSTVGLEPVVYAACGTSDGTGGAIWYRVKEASGSTTISTCGGITNYDSKIRVYRADTDDCVTGNDDSCGLQSTVNFLADPSVEYNVLVHGYSGSEGSFTLSITC